MIKIDKNIPIPPPQEIGMGRRFNGSKYPWDQMEVGDSFFSPDIELKAMRSTGEYQTRRRGWKFAYRTERNGVRVWRVE